MMKMTDISMCFGIVVMCSFDRLSLLLLPRYWYILSEWCQFACFISSSSSHEISFHYAKFDSQTKRLQQSKSLVHSFRYVRTSERLSRQLHCSCPLIDLELWSISLHYWLIGRILIYPHARCCSIAHIHFLRTSKKRRDTFMRWDQIHRRRSYRSTKSSLACSISFWTLFPKSTIISWQWTA